MKTMLITAALGAVLAVPPFRAHVAQVLARLGRGTNVHVVPPPDRR
jgi:hypothetical protein